MEAPGKSQGSSCRPQETSRFATVLVSSLTVADERAIIPVSAYFADSGRGGNVASMTCRLEHRGVVFA